MYERKTAQNKPTLIRRLVNLKYKNGHSVAKHTSDFQGLMNQLNAMKMKIEDELQALLLLSSLPDSWDTLVISLSNSSPNGNLTMYMVKDSLFNEKARRKEHGISSETEAFVTENRSRGKIENLRVVVNPKVGRNPEESLVKEESVIIVVRKDI